MHPSTVTRHGYAEVNDARLYYESRGAGRTLLFIPGGTADATHFAAVADLLANEFRTVTYDRRGNGRSPRPPGWRSTSIGEQADDVAGLIEALGLAPCAVWGGSLGGVILLELLVRRPELVRAALVHEPPLFGVLDNGEQLASGLLRSAAHAIRDNAVRDEFGNHVRQSVGDAFDALAASARERMFSNAEIFFEFEVPAVATYRRDLVSATGALRRLDIPFVAMADPLNQATPPFRAAKWLAHHFDTEFRELPGGHMPYATQPETTAAAIRNVLTEDRYHQPDIRERRLDGRSHDMSFRWGGLADTPEAFDLEQPPARATRLHSTVDVVRYDKYDISRHEDGTHLVSTVLTERFTGAIEGVGYADHVRLLRPDASGIYTGIERVEGTVDGRRGSFILTVHGRNQFPGKVTGNWTVQTGSGTAELTGLRGRGSFTAVADAGGHWHAEDEFLCWFDEPTDTDSPPQRPSHVVNGHAPIGHRTG
jgi:acetyltransferase/esterase